MTMQILLIECDGRPGLAHGVPVVLVRHCWHSRSATSSAEIARCFSSGSTVYAA